MNAPYQKHSPLLKTGQPYGQTEKQNQKHTLFDS
jgi:hypothetical protein